MKRIFIPNFGADIEKLTVALAVGIRESLAMSPALLTLVTPLKDLDRTMMGGLIGKPASKSLMKGQKVPFGNGVDLSYHSYATFPAHAQLPVVLAIHLPEENLRKLDDSFSKCLIYIPWSQNDGLTWAAKWNVEVEGSTQIDSTVELHPKVIEALEVLTHMVNMSSGIVHPSDKENAIGRFQGLRSQGITWVPGEIEKWAVRNKWSVKHAEQLANLSAKYT